MADNIQVGVTEVINIVDLNPSVSTNVIDINVVETNESVTIDVSQPVTQINVNRTVTVTPVTSVNGSTGDVTITKGSLGLSNVDNTSDVNKPISTATQSALNAKEGTVASGTTSQYYRGDKTWQTLPIYSLESLGAQALLGFTPYNSTNPSGFISGITNSMINAALGYTPYNASNPNGYITGITSGNVSTALGYTPYSSANPNNYIGLSSISAGNGISYNPVTGVITSTITQYANSDARNAISLTTNGTSGAATYNAVTGVLNIPSYTGGSGGGASAWGDITGTLSNQTDLQNALNAKQNSLGFTPYNATNPSGYISGITSGNVTTALGYTPYNATNPNGYISGITSGNVTTALGFTPESTSNKGVANGYASLDGGGLIPSTQLPSYVDDVLEYANLAAFPATGVTGKIYVTLDTNKIYRWSGSAYIEVSPTVGTIWGGITGTLANQTDLQNVLDAKQNSLGFTPYNSTNPSGYTSNVGTVTSVAALTLGTTGTDVSSSVATGTSTPVITLNLPSASSLNRGLLTATDWSNFNGKQAALSGTGFVKSTAGTISYDTSTYLTSVGISNLTATGTPSSTTYLRGDNTWATIAGGGFTGVLPAGTATVAPLDFTISGAVLKTSSVAGDMEVDADGILYYSHADVSEGVIHSEQFISSSGTRTLTSQTGAQKLFGTPTNGALTVKAATTYYFECFYSLSSMSGTSGSFGFAIGGTATLTSVGWTSQAIKATTQTTAGTLQTTYNTTAANTTLVSASTQTGGHARIFGTIRVNASGTIIPQVSLGIAAAAVVGANSYFRIIPIGTNTVTSVGNWS